MNKMMKIMQLLKLTTNQLVNLRLKTHLLAKRALEERRRKRRSRLSQWICRYLMRNLLKL